MSIAFLFLMSLMTSFEAVLYTACKRYAHAPFLVATIGELLLLSGTKLVAGKGELEAEAALRYFLLQRH